MTAQPTPSNPASIELPPAFLRIGVAIARDARAAAFRADVPTLLVLAMVAITVVRLATLYLRWRAGLLPAERPRSSRSSGAQRARTARPAQSSAQPLPDISPDTCDEPDAHPAPDVCTEPCAGVPAPLVALSTENAQDGASQNPLWWHTTAPPAPPDSSRCAPFGQARQKFSPDRQTLSHGHFVSIS